MAVNPMTGPLPKALLTELRARGQIIDAGRYDRAIRDDAGRGPTKDNVIVQRLVGTRIEAEFPASDPYKVVIDFSDPSHIWKCTCPDATTSGGMAGNRLCKHCIAAAYNLSDEWEKAWAVAAKAPAIPVAPPPVIPGVAPAALAKEDEGLPIDGGFWAPAITKRLLAAIDKMAKATGAANVIFVGPSGCGKTTLAEKLAQVTKRGFLRVNCPLIRDPEEWFGWREAKDGSTVFDPSELAELMPEGQLVILLDEINRLEPWLLGPLFPLLDHARCTTVHGQTFRVGPDTIFAMTLNEGAQYTGTFQIDEAFRQRAHAVVRVGYPPKDKEQWVLEQAGHAKTVAKDIAEMMAQLREKTLSCDVSVRASLNIANLIKYGLSPREAFEFEVIQHLSDEIELKAARDTIQTKLGVLKA